MLLDTTELQNVVHVMMLAQLALPSVFIAGLIAASGAAQNVIRQVSAEIDAGQIEGNHATARTRRAERFRVIGFVLALLLFVAGTAVPFGYVHEVKAEEDALREFLGVQTGLFVLSWALAAGFVFFAAPNND